MRVATESWTRTDEQARSTGGVRSIDGQPLVADENNEVAEDAEQEDELRDELAQNAQSVVEIPDRRMHTRRVINWRFGVSVYRPLWAFKTQ